MKTNDLLIYNYNYINILNIPLTFLNLTNEPASLKIDCYFDYDLFDDRTFYYLNENNNLWIEYTKYLTIFFNLKISIKGLLKSNGAIYRSRLKYFIFNLSGSNFKAYGNIDSLSSDNNQYYGLFSDNNITDITLLIIDSPKVLYKTFQNTNIYTIPPSLFQHSIQDLSWSFSYCKNLKNVPSIPSGCNAINYMFCNCTNLSKVQILFTLWPNSSSGWLSGVSPTGTFICPKLLEIIRGPSNIPLGWTIETF